MSTKYITKSFHLYFKKKQILGCYNSTPLKMNLVPEIRMMVIKERQILHLWTLLYFAYLLTLLQVTCQTDSKILTDTPITPQVLQSLGHISFSVQTINSLS